MRNAGDCFLNKKKHIIVGLLNFSLFLKILMKLKFFYSKNRFSSSNKNEVILGACSATVCTFLISSRSHTSKLRVNAFIRSLRRSSAITHTSKILASPDEQPLLELGFVVRESTIEVLCIAERLFFYLLAILFAV